MSLKAGVAVDLQADKRFIQHVQGHAMNDVYDALVELVTNADDSYHRLFAKQLRSNDGGDILIEHSEQRKEASRVVVRDKAEGMDSARMEQSLVRLGAYTGDHGNRGYMGRGARDCVALGDLLIESIKEDRYYRARISRDLKFLLEVDGRRATKDQRKEMGIPHGNGTSVSIFLASTVRLPRLETLRADLPWHFALRDLMKETSPSRVLIRGSGGGEGRPERLVYRPPLGEPVLDESFDVQGYPRARGRFQVWKAPDALEAKGDPRFEKAGIIVKGGRGIHECTFLSRELANDPHANRYFGRLECDHIDTLLQEYEANRSKGLEHPPENPRLLIDPNRQGGLERKHPFSAALFQNPISRLKELFKQDREQEQAKQNQVANEETRSKLDELAKLAGKFLQEQLDELEELTGDESVDDRSFMKQGVMIYPTILNVGIGRERWLTVYVRKGLVPDGTLQMQLETDAPDALEMVGGPVALRPHRSKEDRLIGSFRIRGVVPRERVAIAATHPSLPKAEALVNVVTNETDERKFKEPLEFEHDQYSVRLGSKRHLRLYAQCPQVVGREVVVSVVSEDQAKVVVRGRCVVAAVPNSNYAEGLVTVEGRVLKANIRVTAIFGKHRTETKVKVVEKPDDRTVPLRFEVRDEDFGNARAIWAVHEDKPNTLLISAKHKSLARYLGPAKQKHPGQNRPLFRLLLAEIVADSVCTKSLQLEAKERPWEFNWADLQEPALIANNVTARLQKRLREFVARAHGVMLPDDDLKKSGLTDFGDAENS